MQEAKNFIRPGQFVILDGADLVRVRGARSNGVWIVRRATEGEFLMLGKDQIVERVSASRLTARVATVSGVRTEDQPEYTTLKPRASRAKVTMSDDQIIEKALQILQARLGTGPVFDSPGAVGQFLTVRAGAREDQQREVFSVLFLDSQHRLIECWDAFEGTLSQASVYPREVVRRALKVGAAAVILTHNHPSGKAEPSRADENLTQTLKSALALVDVRVLDHFITAGGACRSLAEMGLV